MNEFVTICPCTKQCLCKECENHVEHPITFRSKLWEVTEEGWKCTKYMVYSEFSSLKGISVLTTDVIEGDMGVNHVERTFRYPEHMMRMVEKGRMKVKSLY